MGTELVEVGRELSATGAKNVRCGKQFGGKLYSLYAGSL
jgi:hypothetical protein